MIKQLLFTVLSVFCSLMAYCQLYNNGATITIQNGGYMLLAGNLQNVSGTITNDGKIEVQGNFINSGTYTSTANEDSLIMSGTGQDTLTGGGSLINYLTINKTTASDSVKLGGTTTVNTKLDYLSGGLSTDPILNPSFTLTSPVAAVYNFSTGKEIVGSVKRTGWTNGTAFVFNQPNMQVTTNGGTSPTELTVTMIPQSGGGDPTQNEREVKRKFLFTQTGGSGFSADVRFPYATNELNTNVEANVVPWELISSEWNARLIPVTHDVVNHFVSTTGISAADMALEWKLADPKYTFNVTAFLRGAWNGTSMNTALNSAGVLPLSQPYNTTPFNYTGTESVGGIPNSNIVDWVLIEHRKPASGLASDATSSTITGRKAGFLLNNGTVVDLDGVTPISFNITKQGGSFIVIRHRNHLGVMSNSIPSNPAGTFTNDYSLLANSYKASGATSDPVELLSGGLKYGLWAGDSNKNGVVNGTDVSSIKLAISSLATGYLFTDANLSNSINGTDVSLTKNTISSLGSGSAPTIANGNTRLSAQVQTNIPDPIVE
ncbi:hypothetical protein FW778_17455 [Ginsengibacter hankyongi]|uniref:Dockerin domain-containing protein n=1 Tax=Ginsengibacter hankyongi TaxID=2607284 RepID=A0A5J5IGF6_9BACT|nr:hypothetical protein [Ginsengibacter hankyongi]KAA9037214.1 hypothetical protein FW778_17455 [Ginsengibacter hankyongi]